MYAKDKNITDVAIEKITASQDRPLISHSAESIRSDFTLSNPLDMPMSESGTPKNTFPIFFNIFM